MLCTGGLALGWLTAQLSACASSLPIVKAENKQGLISVPVSAFTEKHSGVIIRNSQLEFDILLVKSENNYLALQMKCTHQDNPLTATATGLFCAAHGSTFDLKGNVLKEPALQPLKKYKSELTESFVLIHIKS